MDGLKYPRREEIPDYGRKRVVEKSGPGSFVPAGVACVSDLEKLRNLLTS